MSGCGWKEISMGARDRSSYLLRSSSRSCVENAVAWATTVRIIAFKRAFMAGSCTYVSGLVDVWRT